MILPWVLCAALGATAAAILATLLGRTERSRSGDFNGQALSFAGSVLLSAFMLTTGFLIVGCWQLHGSLRTHSHDEARELSKTFQRAGGLAPADRDRVRAGLERYTHTVIDVEWKEMGQGRPSVRAWNEIDVVREDLGRITPEPAQKLALDETRKAMDEVYVKRYARIADLDSTPPVLMVIVMAVAGFFVLAYPPLVGMTANSRNIAVLGCAGAIIGMGMYLVLMMRDPFTAPLTVDPDAFRAVLERYTQLSASG